jgi:hypothetical protein
MSEKLRLEDELFRVRQSLQEIHALAATFRVERDRLAALVGLAEAWLSSYRDGKGLTPAEWLDVERHREAFRAALAAGEGAVGG